MPDNAFQVLADNSHVRLDPRTKLLILILINISAFTVNGWHVMVLTALIPVSLFVLSKRYFLSLGFSLLFCAALLSYVFFVDTSVVFLNLIAGIVSGVVCRMGPGFMLGYFLLSSTTVSEFIAAMERMHLPKNIIIPLSVMFRFFPTVREEASSIHDAMKMRGIGFGKSKGNLLSLMEYRLVPLFISCVKIGEELSCSALTRGLGGPVRRTNVCKIGFGARDFFYIAVALSVFLFLLISKGLPL